MPDTELSREWAKEFLGVDQTADPTNRPVGGENDDPDAKRPGVRPGFLTGSSSEAVRDREDTPAPTPPPAPPAPRPFTDVSAQIMQQYEAGQAARGEEKKALEAKAAAMKQPIAEAKQAVAAPGPPPPAPTPLPPAPDLGIRQFLMPRDKEAPEATIAKTISAIGMFATGINGLAKGDARAGLVSLTGAMKGWREGNVEGANLAFKQWNASMEKALLSAKQEHQRYRDILESRALDAEQKMTLLKLSALEHENNVAVASFDVQSHDKAFAQLSEMQKQHDHAQMLMQRLADAKAEKDRQFSLAVERHQERIREADMRYGGKGAFSGTTDEQTIDRLAREFNTTGKMPPMGAGATQIRLSVYKRAAELSAAEGGTNITLANRLAYSGARTEINRLQGQRGLVMAFARNFDQGADFAVKLSETVDRSGVPIWNKWTLAGRNKVGGDKDVSNLFAQTETLAMEYSKVMSGSAQGDATSRQHARELIDAAMTKEQFRDVIQVLKRDTHFRGTTFQQQIDEATAFLRAEKPGPAPAKAKLSRPQFDALKARGYSEQQIREKYDAE